ncbi:MAG: Nif3-like dinuclear metal center hexameric protein [Spirochaetia bacterium]|nr:Nif3-like dinuclear metal center hexameric protein [Spirochaetia bacterium]
MDIKEVDTFFRSILNIEEMKSIDRSLNGLQVSSRTGEITKIAFAVDASLESFKRAAQHGADMIFVHHGLFWGTEKPVTGDYFRRLSFLIEKNIALYAVHLPLDMDPVLGNNITAAKKSGLEELQPFGEYHGKKIGYKGVFPEGKTCEEVISAFGFKSSDILSVLKFGPEKNNSAGVITGGACREVEQAIDERLDLYITGEISHQIYHQCLEAGINVISAGHYLTEIFGIKNVEKTVREKLPLDTCFIDIPTGL